MREFVAIKKVGFMVTVVGDNGAFVSELASAAGEQLATLHPGTRLQFVAADTLDLGAERGSVTCVVDLLGVLGRSDHTVIVDPMQPPRPRRSGPRFAKRSSMPTREKSCRPHERS